uniref:Peptidase M14 domain-containing protein n=1 Tax=Scylla olivacea TaxID=85551 RepID=A0A0P4VZ04_SCYOL
MDGFTCHASSLPCPQINRWMAQLASDHPDLCTLETVGKSYEGRPMNLLTVGKGGADKPGIFIDGGKTCRAAGMCGCCCGTRRLSSCTRVLWLCCVASLCVVLVTSPSRYFTSHPLGRNPRAGVDLARHRDLPGEPTRHQQQRPRRPAVQRQLLLHAGHQPRRVRLLLHRCKCGRRSSAPLTHTRPVT